MRSRGGVFCVLACCAALAVAAGAGLLRGHAQSTPAPTAENSASPATPTAGQPQNPGSGNDSEAARKQEIAGECADLLKMAADLKAEVDKSTKDTLSVTVVRKANEIEQLAHKVRTGSPKG
jgi:hypothetical protein